MFLPFLGQKHSPMTVIHKAARRGGLRYGLGGAGRRLARAWTMAAAQAEGRGRAPSTRPCQYSDQVPATRRRTAGAVSSRTLADAARGRRSMAVCSAAAPGMYRPNAPLTA